MSRYYKHSAISKSAQEILDDCLEKESFNYFASQLKFAVPKIYDQFPPNKHFIEEDVRDHLHALMDGIDSRVEKEHYTHVGRTDITLDFTDSRNTVSKYRIELKLWNRKGYKEAPSQPLKYMAESEKVGAFIMIDRRKKPKYEDFVEIVQNNAEYPCSSVLQVPIVETDLQHFVSFHADARYKSPRMIINFYISIPDKSKDS